MKLALFSITVFEAGEPKFEAGKYYALTDEAQHQVALGNASEVDASEQVERVRALAAKAKAAADKAADSARQAQADLDAATEAARIAQEAEALLEPSDEEGGPEPAAPSYPALDEPAKGKQ